jgi:hypothetical protein
MRARSWSHLFGVGEFVDAILLGTSALSVGLSVFEGAGALFDFAIGAMNRQGALRDRRALG